MMNQIAWLEQNIAEIEQMLSSDLQKSKESPDSFSAKISLKSTENRLADLRKQLQLEKNKREKEVLDFRITEGQGSSGSIPLSILSKIAQYLSDSLLSTAYRQQKGKDPHSSIPARTRKMLDLRLAGIEAGSTRLLITGETRANLFGQSLSEDSLEKVFEVMGAKSGKAITNAVSSAGMKSSRSIAKLCNVLLKNDMEVEINWSSPNGNIHVFDGDYEKLLRLSQSLNGLTNIPPENLSIDGTLTMSSMKGSFEISCDKKSYKGKFPEKLLTSIRKINLGDPVIALIEKETIINPTTGYEKQTFTLVNVMKKDENHAK